MFRRILGLAVVIAAGLAARADAQNLLMNGGLETVLGEDGRDSAPPGWTTLEGPPVSANDPNNPEHLLSLGEPGNFDHLLLEGFWHFWFQPYNGTFADAEVNFAHLEQLVPGQPGKQYTLTGWALFESHYAGGRDNLNFPGSDAFPPDDGPLSPTDSFFSLAYLDAASNVLGMDQVELKANGQLTDTQWKQHTVVGVSPAGTVSVRVRASMINGVLNDGVNPQSFMVDDFALTAINAPPLGGDFDGDFDADGVDFLKWQRGESPMPLSASDFNAWKGSFGSATGAAQPIPEPRAAAIGLILAAWAVRGIRTRR
jgi:hypothetical protein